MSPMRKLERSGRNGGTRGPEVTFSDRLIEEASGNEFVDGYPEVPAPGNNDVADFAVSVKSGRGSIPQPFADSRGADMRLHDAGETGFGPGLHFREARVDFRGFQKAERRPAEVRLDEVLHDLILEGRPDRIMPPRRSIWPFPESFAFRLFSGLLPPGRRPSPTPHREVSRIHRDPRGSS